MKRAIKQALTVIAITLMPILLWSTNAYSVTPQQIYVWVARHMNIEHVSGMPEVTFVGKEKLQQMFRDFNYKSYAQLETDHGKAYAQEMLSTYLDNVVGLFHPETRAIFVGDFLEPCRRQAVLAHEFVHYFQDVKHGRIRMDDYRADDKRTLREMQAYDIESKFVKLFCDADNPPNN